MEGWVGDQLTREEFVRTYYPQTIAGKQRRTIAWTTAASICAVVEMVNNGQLPDKGFIRQEEIPLEPFLATRNGSYYGGKK